MTATAPSLSLPPPKRRGRPKGDPEKSLTRARLIRAGLVHLTERGYGATGVDEILKAAGVPRGSFYHHFGSKADFGLQLIDAYNAYFIAKIRRALGDDSLPPIDRLRRLMQDAEAGMARHGFSRGCLIGNLGQEMAVLPEPFRARLIEVLADWQALTATCLRAAKKDGQLRADLEPETLAAVFWTGWEGAVLRAKMERDPAPLRQFSTTFLNLITP